MSKPFAEPAYTQISNAALDEVLPAVSPAVWKLICVILRKTKGYQKPEDELSYSQLVTLTGMARATVADAITEALELKLIIRRGAGQRFFYRTNPEYESTSSEIEPVQKLNQTSSETEPEPVQKLNTQKKERKPLKKIKEGAPNGATPDPRLKHPAVIAYRDMAHLTPPAAVRDDLCAVQDAERFGVVIKDWIGKGWNPRNISGMLDVYRNGARQKQSTNGHKPTAAAHDPAAYEAERARKKAEAQAALRGEA